MESAIYEILRADHPQSVRHVFYRLTDPALGAGSVEKTEAGYRAVQRRMVKMRLQGRLPYRWIIDMTRRGYHVQTFKDGPDLIRRFAGLYRYPLWEQAAVHVEVWCESRSLAAVLQADCEDLAVSLYPCGGFSSLSLTHEAAMDIASQCADTGKNRAVIVYAGDYDPAGVMIDQDVARKLRGHLEPKGIELELIRVAVNPDQIAAMKLPTKPRKAGDRRRLDVVSTVEAEAIPASTMRALVREAVEQYLPAHALEVAKFIEAEESRVLIENAEQIGQMRQAIEDDHGEPFWNPYLQAAGLSLEPERDADPF